LVLEPHRTALALHYHFESVEAAVLRGADIIPSITVVRQWDRPKTVADSQRGRRIRSFIEQLERLIAAYRNHELRERPST
jgi:fructose-1,6-bisphosphatase-3